MANEISRVIEKIGLHKFAAVVTDSAPNLRVARRMINESYPHVLDFRCAAHAANLIASDFCKFRTIKPIISNCSTILKFFQSSHIAHGHYQEQLKAMKIKGGEIKTYTKTRWGSFCMTVDSIIRSKPVFDWVRVLTIIYIIVKILY